MDGWIKLHRRILNWEWYDDINTKVLFLHLLLTANHKEQKWRGQKILRGQKLTSIQHLADETQLTPKQVRVALDKLKMTNEVATKGTNKYTLITIEKYSDYQDYDEKKGKQNDTQQDKQRANKGQTKGKQRATNNNDKNIKNDNNDKNILEKKEYKEKKETEFDILINQNFVDENIKNTIYEFIKMRKAIKKPLTTHGLELLIKKLYQMTQNVDEQIEILNNSILNNWQGIFPLRKELNKTKGGFDDFKQLWEEARLEDEQNGNNTNNNTFGW